MQDELKVGDQVMIDLSTWGEVTEIAEEGFAYVQDRYGDEREYPLSRLDKIG